MNQSNSNNFQGSATKSTNFISQKNFNPKKENNQDYIQNSPPLQNRANSNSTKKNTKKNNNNQEIETVTIKKKTIKSSTKVRNPRSNRSTNKMKESTIRRNNFTDVNPEERRKIKMINMIKNAHIQRRENFILLKELNNAYNEIQRYMREGDYASAKMMENELNELHAAIVMANLNPITKMKLGRSTFYSDDNNFDSTFGQSQNLSRSFREKKIYEVNKIKKTKRIKKNNEQYDEEENEEEEDDNEEMNQQNNRNKKNGNKNQSNDFNNNNNNNNKKKYPQNKNYDDNNNQNNPNIENDNYNNSNPKNLNDNEFEDIPKNNGKRYTYEIRNNPQYDQNDIQEELNDENNNDNNKKQKPKNKNKKKKKNKGGQNDQYDDDEDEENNPEEYHGEYEEQSNEQNNEQIENPNMRSFTKDQQIISNSQSINFYPNNSNDIPNDLPSDNQNLDQDKNPNDPYYQSFKPNQSYPPQYPPMGGTPTGKKIPQNLDNQNIPIPKKSYQNPTSTIPPNKKNNQIPPYQNKYPNYPYSPNDKNKNLNPNLIPKYPSNINDNINPNNTYPIFPKDNRQHPYNTGDNQREPRFAPKPKGKRPKSSKGPIRDPYYPYYYSGFNSEYPQRPRLNFGKPLNLRRSKSKDKERRKSPANILFAQRGVGSCFACDVDCSISRSGNSPNTYNPYLASLKYPRKDITFYD